MTLCPLTVTHTNIVKSCNKNGSGPKYQMAACMGSKDNPEKHTSILLQHIKGQMETWRALDLMVEASEAKCLLEKHNFLCIQVN